MARGHDRQLRATILSPFVGQKLGMLVKKETHEDEHVLKELVESGKLTPIIDRTYPLAEAPGPSATWKKDTPRGRSSSPSYSRPRKGCPFLDPSQFNNIKKLNS